jgi:acyl carrier protein
MDAVEIKAKLTPLFRDVFANDDIIAQEDLSAKDVEGWDSLSHINMIVAVEKTFKVRFTTREVSSLKKVGDLIDLIKQKASS